MFVVGHWIPNSLSPVTVIKQNTFYPNTWTHRLNSLNTLNERKVSEKHIEHKVRLLEHIDKYIYYNKYSQNNKRIFVNQNINKNLYKYDYAYYNAWKKNIKIWYNGRKISEQGYHCEKLSKKAKEKNKR